VSFRTARATQRNPVSEKKKKEKKKRVTNTVVMDQYEFLVLRQFYLGLKRWLSG
jgi:hypothetical protein